MMKKQLINYIYIYHLFLVEVLKILFFLLLFICISNVDDVVSLSYAVSPTDGTNDIPLIKNPKHEEKELLPEHKAGRAFFGCLAFAITFIIIVKYFNIK